MRRVSAKNKSVNQQHLVKYTQRVYIIVPVKGNCAIYYYFVNKGHGASGIGHRASGMGHRAWGIGHRASGMGHGAWGMGHGAWGMGHGAWGMGHGKNGIRIEHASKIERL
jgi:hypothetical protein